MRWAPTKNAAPASSDMLRANLAKEEGALASFESEGQEIEAALPGLVAEPDRYVEAEARLREIEVLRPSKRRTIEAIRQAIPQAEEREERERLTFEIEARAAKSAKLSRGLKARYEKAAAEYAAILREIAEDNGEWGRLYLNARMQRVPITDGHRSAESAVRRAANPTGSGWQGSVTDNAVVRAFDGERLFG